MRVRGRVIGVKISNVSLVGKHFNVLPVSCFGMFFFGFGDLPVYLNAYEG